jgi:nucleotide-binding universal stress UspA family protein
LLHVVDVGFIEQLAEEGFSTQEAATTKLREKAEARLQEIIAAIPDPKPQIEPMVVVGRPFAEVLRIVGDLDFGIIVLGTRGRRGADLEEILFGSTAEKVIRGARVPVLCVPTA